MPVDAVAKRPEPAEFGLTVELIEQAKRLEERSHGEPGLGWMDNLLGSLVDNLGWVGSLIGFLLVFTILWPFLLIGLLLGPLLQKFPRTPDPLLVKYRSYLAAVATFEKAEAERDRQQAWLQQEFWRRLSGTALELEVAALLQKLGHQVTRTGGSGDGGVDLLVDLDTIVQCKCHAGAVSPSVVRDLLGAKTFRCAKQAILVATSGATSGAVEFARQAEIEIWDAAHLVKLRKQLPVLPS